MVVCNLCYQQNVSSCLKLQSKINNTVMIVTISVHKLWSSYQYERRSLAKELTNVEYLAGFLNDTSLSSNRYSCINRMKASAGIDL